MLYNKSFKSMEWSKLLKGIRFIQSLTQKELSKKLNLHRIQLLKYEQGKKPWIKTRNIILKYIQDNNLNIKGLFETYSKVNYLDENHLWGKLVDGVQTINGWNNKEVAELLDVDKTVIESWKFKKSIPKPNTKSKILKLVGNHDMDSFLKYSNINWKQHFYEIRKQLPVSKTMLGKLLGFNGICVNGLIGYGKPQFKLKKEIIELRELIKKRKDIRDVIFEKRKQRFFDNKYLWFRCIRESLGISQDELVKNTVVAQDLYGRFELGQQNLTKEKREIIERKFKFIAKIRGLDYNKIKSNSIKSLNNLKMNEIRQWKLREDIHEIIGFRMLHRKERSYVNHICALLNKQGFMTFTNAILSDNDLSTFHIDIYALKQKRIKLCIEVKDRTNNRSTSVTFQHNVNRLKTIKDIFNLDYSILLVSCLTPERKRYSCGEVILLDRKDLDKLKHGHSFLDLLKNKESPRILEINTIKKFKRYLRQNKLTLRDVASVISIPFSQIKNWTKDIDIKTAKKELTKLKDLVNIKGIAYVKFQRYKKIYTNKEFLKLKGIKNYLRLSEKDFKKYFGVKPSELVDKCLRDTCSIPKELLLKIRKYVNENDYDWQSLSAYIRHYVNKELQKWKQLEKYNKQMGWKFIKFLDNTNNKSKALEDKVSNFLSKRYTNILRNVQVYLTCTNQVREIDLISFNTSKDLLITECKLRIPRYGSKIILNDLDTIKKTINAKHYWLVTQKTNLNMGFNKI